MKIIVLFLFLFLYIKTLNSQIQQQQIQKIENNSNIDIYFSSNGNDTTGNGTINYPYRTLCKLLEIFDQGNSISKKNFSIITIYFGYSDFNYSNCSDIYISNYNSVSIKSYNSSRGINNNNNNISNLYFNLYIDNSNLNFKGEFLKLNLNSTWINYSNVIFEEKIKVTFLGELNNIEFSNVTIRGESLLAFIIDETINRIQVVNSSILVTERSTLNNINFDLMPVTMKMILIINEKSSVIGSFISIGDGYIEISNAIFQDSILVCGGFANITNSTFTQTTSTTIQQQFFEESLSFFTLLIGGKLTMADSKIHVLKNVMPYPIIYSDSGCLVDLYNVSITGYIQTTPIFRLESNVVMTTNFVHFDGCVSSAVLQISNSVLSMSGGSFSGCVFDTMIEVGGPSELMLSDIFFDCKDGNTFSSMVTMPTSIGSFTNKSLIILTNVGMSCVGGFDFRNATVSFVNVTLSASFEIALISLYSSSDITVDECIFYSSSPNPYGTIFNINNGSLTIVNCVFAQCSTTILKATQLSMVYIDNTEVISLRLTGQSAFIVEDSILDISGSFFDNNQLTAPLIYSMSSEVILYCTNVTYFGSTLLSSEESIISISFLNMTESFTQNILFISLYDKITVSNSIFENNHGFSSVLFDVFQGELTVSTTTFSGNSFGPMFSTYNSTLFFNNIEYKNNSGSFIKSVEDQSLRVYSFQYIDNKVPYDYLFLIDETLYVSFQSIEISNNYLNQYYLQALEVGYLEVMGISFTNNIAYSIAIPSSIPIYSPVEAFFNFIDCNVLKFDSWYFENNQIACNLLSIYYPSYNSDSLITIDGLWFSNNNIKENTQHVFQIENVNNITFNGCQMLGNFGNATSLIKSKDSNITIINSVMSDNNFKYNGNGSILNYDITEFESSKFYFQILNSTFSNNIAQIGGVFKFTNFINTSFVNPLSKFQNNIISYNQATIQGGAIYTDFFKFSLNIQEILLSNSFLNNTSFNGNDFSSMMDNGIFTNNKNVANGEGTLIEYEFLDFYGNIFTTFSSNLNISITRLSTNQTNYISNSATAGKGNFLQTFIGYVNESYRIECNLPKHFQVVVFVQSCLPFQYYDDDKTCVYCPINYVYTGIDSNNKSKSDSSGSGNISSSYSNDINSSISFIKQQQPMCTKCDSSKISCMFSSVYSLEGYYLIDQDAANVQKCAQNMCLKNNTCVNSGSIGILCFECVDKNGNQVISKNGIHCCSHFKPFLLLPILIVYFIFGLGLSLAKYFLFSKESIVGSVFLFLQTNSVVFFSYSGIYILPLFRMSIDMLDGYCLWSSLNYIQKSFISFSIIISLFLIGSTDITLSIIQFFCNKINNINNNNNSHSANSQQNINLIISPEYPNFINNIIIESKKDEIYKIKSIWSLFQLFIIPLAFNSISLMSFKKLNNQTYLSVDFSITLGGLIFVFSQIVSYIFILIILIFLVVLLIITLTNATITMEQYPINSLIEEKHSFFNLKRLYKLKNQLYYKKQYKWWDSIIIVKSILYSALSIVMLFEYNEYYLGLLMSIQIIYSSLYILICPIKKFASRDLNNIINLFELLILIFVDSTLFKTIVYKGLSITIIVFTLTLLLILFDNFYIKKLNNNNSNSKNVYSRLPTKLIINKSIN